MPSSFVERKITGKMRVRISGDEEVLRNPLFAINWFDTRVALVYHFYNLIAAPRVFKVGGKALFKGQYQETIYGNPDMATQVSVDCQLSIGQSLSRSRR